MQFNVNKFSDVCIQTYLTACKDFIAVGLGDLEFQAQLLNIVTAILRGGIFFILSIVVFSKRSIIIFFSG